MTDIEQSRYKVSDGEVRYPVPVFTPGSLPASEQAKWLTQAGLAGVDELNPAHIMRLNSNLGIREVDAALKVAQKVKEETGSAPDVRAIDLAELVRLARASDKTRGNKNLAKKVEQARARLYAKIAQPAGALAVNESNSAG